MKRIGAVGALLCAALVVMGCATGPSPSESMASARRGVPEGTLVSQATGPDAQKAESEAKGALVRAMSSMVKEMADEAVAAGRLQSSVANDFRGRVNLALSRSSLSGAVKQEAGGKGKEFWAVYYMDKSAVVREITSAVTAAKEVVPAAAAFNLDGMDKAYVNAIARDWKN